MTNKSRVYTIVKNQRNNVVVKFKMQREAGFVWLFLLSGVLFLQFLLVLPLWVNILLTLINVFFAYLSAYQLFSSLYIIADNKYVRVVSKPIPNLRGYKKVAISDIRRIYTEPKKVRSRTPVGTYVTRTYYDILVEKKDGKRVALTWIDGFYKKYASDLVRILQNGIGVSEVPQEI